MWYFLFFGEGCVWGWGLFKTIFAFDFISQNDLYVNSPFSQILDDGTKKKYHKSGSRMQRFCFFPFSILRCRECFEFSLKTLKLNKVSNVKMSAENGWNVRSNTHKYIWKDLLSTPRTLRVISLLNKGISACKWSVLVSFNFKCLKCVSHSLIFTHKHTMLAELSHEDLAWYWEGLGEHLVKGHLSSWWGQRSNHQIYNSSGQPAVPVVYVSLSALCQSWSPVNPIQNLAHVLLKI